MSDKTSNIIEEVVALNGNANPLSTPVLAAVREVGKASGQMDAAQTKLQSVLEAEGLTSWTLAVAKGWEDAEKQEAHNAARLQLFAEACTARGNVIDPPTGEKTFPTHKKHGSAGKTFLKFPTADERDANLTPLEQVQFDRVYNGTSGSPGVVQNMNTIYIRLQREEIKAYYETMMEQVKLLRNPKTKAKEKEAAKKLKAETLTRLSAYPPSRLKEVLGKNNPVKSKRKKSGITEEESIKTEVLTDLASVRERTGDVDLPWWKENVGADDELREKLQALLDRDSFAISTLRDLVFARYGVLDQDDGSDNS